MSRLRADGSGFLNLGSGAEGFMFTVLDGPAARGTASDTLEDLSRARDRASGRQRRKAVTDELLDRVAHVYRQAIEAGRPPKKAVQAAEGVSEATAGRYIQRARERGYLGKTTWGKKGESCG
jgi:hypothetical protein